MAREIIEEVKDILTDKWNIDREDIVDDVLICTGLGLDSLDKVEFIMELEKSFDINIDDDLAEDLHTFKEFVEIVKVMTAGRKVK
jgi:acyl carrier protein